MERSEKRALDQSRTVIMEKDFLPNAEGSCLIKVGNTHVICSATVEERVPPFLRNTGKGWITAEYAMLPRCSPQRIDRENRRGPGGRTQEIQRLIGRSLRAILDFEKLGERQIKIDCDVLRADGGTRTASITGGFVALQQAIQGLLDKGSLKENPLKDTVSAFSCGIVKGNAVLDLDYPEDSSAEVDANFVITGSGSLVEVQASAEGAIFTEEQLQHMMSLAKKGCSELSTMQKGL